MAGQYPWLVGVPSWRGDVTYSGGSWLAGYPLANLSVPPFAKVARSTDAQTSSTQFRGVFSARRQLDLIRFDHHTIGRGGTITVHGFRNAGDTTPIVSTDPVPTFPQVYDENAPQASWDSNNWWDRTYTDRDMQGQSLATNVVLPGSYSVEAFVAEINYPQSPDGYIQIGLVEPAQAVVLNYAPENGGKMGFDLRTAMTQSDGGGKKFQRKQKAKTFSGNFPYVPHDDAMSVFYEMQRQLDIDTPFIWLPNQGSPLHELRESFLATFTQLDDITRELIGYDSVPVTLEEFL